MEPSSSSDPGPSSSSGVGHVQGRAAEMEYNSLQLRLMHYRLRVLASNAVPTDVIRDGSCSCLVIFNTFWFLASVAMIRGFYGSTSIQMGPNFSTLVHASPLFVQSIKAQELGNANIGTMLYGFYDQPPLDVEITWSETHNVSIQPGHHKEWQYFLNKGSKLDISYSVKSPSYASLLLIIAEGRKNFVKWIEDPSNPRTTVFQDIIHGHGLIEQEMFRSQTHFIALSSLNSEEVEVQLHFRISAVVYNTTLAYHKCSLSLHICNLRLFLSGASTAIITSPRSVQGMPTNEWYVKLSYGPRWVTYFVSSAPMTTLMFLAIKIRGMLFRRDRDGFRAGEMGSRQAPLLSQNDDDDSIWGSSYDSFSQDEAGMDELLAAVSDDQKQLEGEASGNNPQRLCHLCSDALKDSFFLPCGHCAACFTCGTRVVQEAGACPVCHRAIKKVRLIITV